MRGLFVAILVAWVCQAVCTAGAWADPPPPGAQRGNPAFHGHLHGRGVGHPFHTIRPIHRGSVAWWAIDLPRWRWFSLSSYGAGGVPCYVGGVPYYLGGIPYYGSGIFALGDYGLLYSPGIYPAVPWIYDGVFLYGGPVVYPPVILPAETLFGPAAVRRFMGIEPAAPRGIANLPPRVEEAPGGEAAKPPAAVPAHEVPPHAKMAAERLLGIGDSYFAQEKYGEALDRYRRAAQAARGLAEPWFRQGFALVAQERYEAAARAFRTGLRLDARWPGSGFSLHRLYGNAAALETHLEALAQAAELQPDSADLLFLVGVLLYFSGQQDRSEPFFQRAEQLTRGDKSHLRAFLRHQ